MVEMHYMIAGFLKLSILMVFGLFMLFMSLGIGCYIYEFLESHIIEVF